MNLAPETAQFLASLGWSEQDMNQNMTAMHPEHPGLEVTMVQSRDGFWNHHKFAAAFTCPIGSYRRQDADQIKRVVIDYSRPHWKRSMLKWFSAAVMKAGELRRLKEEEDAKLKAVKREQVRHIANLLPDDLREFAPTVPALGSVYLNHDGTLEGVYARSWVNFALPNLMTAEDKLAFMARLARFLRQEKLIEE
jgi:hypothetical protein